MAVNSTIDHHNQITQLLIVIGLEDLTKENKTLRDLSKENKLKASFSIRNLQLVAPRSQTHLLI